MSFHFCTHFLSPNIKTSLHSLFPFLPESLSIIYILLCNLNKCIINLLILFSKSSKLFYYPFKIRCIKSGNLENKIQTIRTYPLCGHGGKGIPICLLLPWVMLINIVYTAFWRFFLSTITGHTSMFIILCCLLKIANIKKFTCFR